MSFSDEVCADVARDVQWMQCRIEALEAENMRLKIAHLRRMAAACWDLEGRALLNASERSDWHRYPKRRREVMAKVGRFRSACLAKITELKESQCSAKS